MAIQPLNLKADTYSQWMNEWMNWVELNWRKMFLGCSLDRLLEAFLHHRCMEVNYDKPQAFIKLSLLKPIYLKRLQWLLVIMSSEFLTFPFLVLLTRMGCLIIIQHCGYMELDSPNCPRNIREQWDWWPWILQLQWPCQLWMPAGAPRTYRPSESIHWPCEVHCSVYTVRYYTTYTWFILSQGQYGIWQQGNTIVPTHFTNQSEPWSHNAVLVQGSCQSLAAQEKGFHCIQVGWVQSQFCHQYCLC